MSNSSPVKLYLGCFNKPIHGFINVDIRKDTKCDIVDDIFTLKKFKNNSVDLALAVHVVEHLERKKILPTFQRWYEVLKPGGRVYIAVPDMEAVFAHYFYHKDLKLLYSSLGGSQNYPEDFHLSHFDFTTLQELLVEAGFHNIERYDALKTEWAYVDSYEKAYWPHMDFTGKLLSLNVTGQK